LTNPNSLRLIIIGSDFHNAETCNSALRAMGYAIKSTRVASLNDLDAALKNDHYELVLYCLSEEILSLPEARTCLDSHQQGIPIIVLDNAQKSNLDPAEIMHQGATDLIQKENFQHLKQVIKRERHHFQTQQHLDRITTRYNHSEKRSQALMNSSRDAIAYIHDGMHIQVNATYLELFGLEADEITSTPIMDMVATEHQQKLKEFLRHQHKNKKVSGKLAIQLLHSTQTSFSGEMEFAPASIDGEQCTQIIIRDRSDAKELERQLLHQSRTDSLTQLYNRQHLTTLLGQEAKKASKGNHKSILLQIHLDDLNTIKKTCGIIGADQFLVAISKVLRKVANPKDLLFRFTGPTFMLLSHGSDTEKAKHYAQQIISRVEKYICTLSGHTTSSSCCIGICQIDDSTKTATDILSRSDRALNAAINNNDDDSSLSLYTPNTTEQSQKQVDHTWALSISKALKTNNFRLLYQPIVALEGDHTERYEVDIRLLDKNGKEMEQNEFLDAAQRTGLSRGINRWTINKAIEQLHKKHKSGNNTVFFIKLTKDALQDPDLFRYIHSQIKTTRIAPDSLVFEIEEETAHSQLKQARAFAKALLQINCRVAISHFGRSAKPFQLFKHVPAQYLKIDDDLMEELSTNNDSQSAVRAIMSEAKLKKIATIAPGIENANSLSVLWSMSADYIQGGFLRHASEKLDYDFTAMSA